MSNTNEIFSKLLVGMSKIGGWAFPKEIDELFPVAEGSPVPMKKIAAMVIWEEAGFTPAKTTSLPSPDAGETPPVWDDALISAVRNAIAFDTYRFRKETFQAVIGHRATLPHELLVDALDFGKRNEDFRNQICEMLGSRGKWLAMQNADWEYAVGIQSEDDEDIWTHGNSAQRQTLFRRWRKTDRNHANEMLEKDFDDLGASERSNFLEAIDSTLHPEDEGILNRFLAVRGKEIRTAACRSLSKIHTSDFAAKVSAIMATLLKKEKALLRGKWVIDAPETFVPEWKSLGIEETKSKDSKIGDRGNLLRQIATLLPLKWWENTMGMTPSEILSWAKKTDWEDPLFIALSSAFEREPDEDWAHAFLSAPKAWRGSQGNTELLAHLPQKEQETLWLENLRTETGRDFGNKLQILCDGFTRRGRRPSAGFSSAISELIQKFSEWYDYALPKSMPEFVSIVPTESIGVVIKRLEEAKPSGEAMSNAIVKALTIMENRRTIHRYFPAKETT